MCRSAHTSLVWEALGEVSTQATLQLLLLPQRDNLKQPSHRWKGTGEEAGRGVLFHAHIPKPAG